MLYKVRHKHLRVFQMKQLFKAKWKKNINTESYIRMSVENSNSTVHDVCQYGSAA